MTKHLFKLIWNRKRENALMIVELLASFLVIFFIAAVAAHAWWLYHQPLGYQWEDAYELRIQTENMDWTESDGETLQQVLAAVRNEPRVEWAHAALFGPFRSWNWTSDVAHDDVIADTMLNSLSDGAPQDLGIELTDGRWFGPEDTGSQDHIVLINERLKRELFGDQSPLGADIRNYNPDSREEEKAYRVVGVFRDFRQGGEMSELENFVLTRFRLESKTQTARVLLIQVEPGTPVSFEEELQNLVQGIARDWTVTLTPLEKLRRQALREVFVPLTVGAVVAAFLLLMVAFGLFGVLWQNVTRRTDELGLRRAVGATRNRIYRQIVGEIVVIALLAVIAGALIGIQFPMLGTFESLDWRASSQALIVAATTIGALCVVCALYPAWLASRRSPAEALHYE